MASRFQGEAPSDRVPRFMLVPFLGCPASCSYCFGPHQGPVISSATADAAVDFIARTASSAKKLKLTFHGGEPLVAGAALFRRVLDSLTERCAAAGGGRLLRAGTGYFKRRLGVI
jgi:uncharacterized protein